MTNNNNREGYFRKNSALVWSHFLKSIPVHIYKRLFLSPASWSSSLLSILVNVSPFCETRCLGNSSRLDRHRYESIIALRAGFQAGRDGGINKGMESRMCEAEYRASRSRWRANWTRVSIIRDNSRLECARDFLRPIHVSLLENRRHVLSPSAKKCIDSGSIFITWKFLITRSYYCSLMNVRCLKLNTPGDKCLFTVKLYKISIHFFFNSQCERRV